MHAIKVRVSLTRIQPLDLLRTRLLSMQSRRVLAAVHMQSLALTTRVSCSTFLFSTRFFVWMAECEGKCSVVSNCIAVDTDGHDCYLKSKCDGTPGECHCYRLD